MAKYPAIAVVGMALLNVLEDSCPKPEFANAQFDLYQSSNFAAPMDEGISLYLYRVTINGALRNTVSRLDSNGKRRRPPLPLDIHFMLTSWAKTAAKQQRLLGWAMHQIEDIAILPSGLLNSVGPEPGIFRSDEMVEIICDPISMQDMFNIWENLKSKMQVSVTYVARMVMIESALQQAEAPPVQVRDFGMMQEIKP